LAAISSYRDLKVWEASISLAEEVYKTSSIFPSSETYGLSQQLRRSAVSIPSNIAEGHARTSSKEFLYFISIAFGSLAEVETQLTLAKRLGFLKQENLDSLLVSCDEIGKMLRGLQNAIKRKLSNP
jgi:four helix bundle protein